MGRQCYRAIKAAWRSGLALIAFISMAVSGAVEAQETKKESGERVMLVLRTNNTLKDGSKLSFLFEEAKRNALAKKLNVGWGEVPKPVEVGKDIYDFISDPSLPPEAGGVVGTRITPHVGSAWIIDIGGHGDLKKIEFKYAGEKNKEDPSEIEGGDQRLTRYTVRNFKLAVEFNTLPKECVLTILDGKYSRTETQKWPEAPDRFWLVQLREFTGDKGEFFKLLRDYVYATPIRDVAIAKSTTFVVGDLRTGTTTVDDDRWSGNRYQFARALQFDAQSNQLRSERAFILFPLTKQRAEEEAKRLNGMKPDAIMKEILDANPITALDEKAALRPDMKPTWIEIPKAVGQLRRNLAVEDVRGWKDRLGKPTNGLESYSITVYEKVKTNPDDPAVAAEATHPTRNEATAMAAIDLEQKQWPIGVMALPIPKKDPKDPK
jgi:hypothetical protein